MNHLKNNLNLEIRNNNDEKIAFVFELDINSAVIHISSKDKPKNDIHFDISQRELQAMFGFLKAMLN